MKMLITGGAGFIGHHLVGYILRHCPDVHMTLMDRLDGSGNLNRLAEIGAVKNPRVKFFYHDLRAPLNDLLMSQLGTFDAIVHLAAATHVDRSIAFPMEFVQDNVVATCNLLEYARRAGCGKFIQFSTDEVFGPAPEGVFYKEDDRFHCSNPYSATKAGAEELAMAYFRTYKVPVIVTHTMNVCGIRQHPEKMIPGTIAKILNGQPVIIHANKDKGTPGSRVYINAQDVADAVMFLLADGLGRGAPGEKYNIAGLEEVDNLQLAGWIAEFMGRKLDYELVDGARPGNRPGHDLRYALDSTKLERIGWKPTLSIHSSVKGITDWSLKNTHWLNISQQESK
jgi:dTDP-glucose 4,6-dehydratase